MQLLVGSNKLERGKLHLEFPLILRIGKTKHICFPFLGLAFPRIESCIRLNLSLMFCLRLVLEMCVSDVIT